MKKHIIISIHGIRTYGRWQERLGNLLRAGSSCAEYHIYTYGYFSAVAFLIPPLRWLVVRRFRKCILTLRHDNPEARIDLVAHSFGTHIAAWAILDAPPYIRPNVHTLILAGSVLKAGFPWEELISANAVRRVVNDCGIDDKVLILNQLCVLFTGMAGRIGFAGLTGDRLVNRFFPGGHSLYFEDGKGQDSDLFMKQWWVPLLSGDGAVSLNDARPAPTVWAGVKRTIIQNSEPLKLLLYTLLFVIPFLFVLRLYFSAESARASAVLHQKQTLATLEWAINRTSYLPAYNRDDSVGGLRLLKGIIVRLRNAEFRGTVMIIGHVGSFCYEHYDEAHDSYDPPKSIDQCPMSPFGVGWEVMDSDALVKRLGFELRGEMKPGSGIKVDLFSAGQTPQYCYPPKNPDLASPADWNAIAGLNNRIEVRLIPEGAKEDRSNVQTCIPYQAKPDALTH